MGWPALFGGGLWLVKAQKNDDRDAEAIAEAATRPTMRIVRIKTHDQSDVQSLHRARSRLVSERTALINNLRSLLLERGIRAIHPRKYRQGSRSDQTQNKATH